MLDPRALFADYDGPKQAIDVLARTKQRRNRSGYEDGAEVLYKECPAETFVHSDKPAELLGLYHAFILDASVSHRTRSIPPVPSRPARSRSRLRPPPRDARSMKSPNFTVCPTVGEDTFC